MERTSFNGADRVTCPFAPCGAWVIVMQTQPHEMLSMHEMPDYSGRLAGVTCPASLMRWPLGNQELKTLAQQEQSMAARIARDYGEHVDLKMNPRPAADNKSTKVGGRRTDQPRNSPGWQLGGRADEDIIPAGQENTGVVPRGVQGTPVGRGSGMASIPEVMSMLNASTIAGSEAAEALVQASEAIQRARAAVAEVLSTGHSDSLSTAMYHYGLVVESIGQCTVAIHEGGEKTETYMQNLQS